MNKVHRPGDGRIFTARELAELLLTQPDRPVMVNFNDGDAIIGARLNAVKFDGFHQRWDLTGPNGPQESFTDQWVDSFGNPVDILASVNMALRDAGIDKRIDCVNGQAVAVPVPEVTSSFMSDGGN